MARKTPRWYQREAVDAGISAIQSARNTHPILAIVTGGGKSLIASMLAEELIALHPTARVMVLAPSQELVSQNAVEAYGYLMPGLAAQIGIYCASLNRKDRQRRITHGTHQSVWRQARRFGPIDYVVVDEADGFDLSLKSVRKLVEGLREINPHVRFVGLTATPFRQKGVKTVPLSQCGLFTAKVIDLTTGRNYNRLIREGYIAPIVAPTVRFPQINLDNVKTKGEDYDEAQLAVEAMKITEEVVDVALRELDADGRKHIMWFGVNVAHARMMHQSLLARGETSTLIYGDLDKGERVDGIREFMAKETRHIVSVSALCIGFNAPHVDALVLNFATKSQRKFRQTVGRGGRPEVGKENCLVLDAGGNFARLGAINADLEQGDSRAGLWECSATQMEGPTGPQRERSGIRFPAPSPEIEERDIRVVLGLEGFVADEPGCGYLNDPEHMLCRNCSRPRQGFITQSRKPDPKDPTSGIGDGYDMHDEDSIILRDELCVETKSFPVNDTTVKAIGDSVLVFQYETDVGPYTLRLDFDRKTADNRFFAQARKYWEVSTGRKLPNEPHRVLLQREAIPQPSELTLTKTEDGIIWLTELRFIRDGQMETFRYDPSYGK